MLQASNADLHGTVAVAFMKTFIFTLVVPGSVTIWIPYWLLDSGVAAGSRTRSLRQRVTVSPVPYAPSVHPWCAWALSSPGKGTPAPIDPPRVLIVRGLYKHVRNPMYVGVLSVLIGEALCFQSWALLGWAGVVFSAFSGFIILYEEPKLKRLFGASYGRYLETVPRWLPTSKKADKPD